MVNCYNDFLKALYEAGFSFGSGNPSGIYTVIPVRWDEPVPEGCEIRWFSENREIDPWEWRNRVIEEQTGILYGKFFFGCAGYITPETYPYFYALRRHGSFDESYQNGEIPYIQKRIYDLLRENGAMAFHELKFEGGFTKEENAAFEKAISDLQAEMFITVCGRKQKANRFGIGYGWQSGVFCLTEEYAGEPDFIEENEAESFLTEKILTLNPQADARDIHAFLYGKKRPSHRKK